MGWLGAFVAFFRLSLPQPERRVLTTPTPIVDPRTKGNFWCVEEAPGQVPVTTYGNWAGANVNGRHMIVEAA